jgi:hypothetical protein
MADLGMLAITWTEAGDVRTAARRGDPAARVPDSGGGGGALRRAHGPRRERARALLRVPVLAARAHLRRRVRALRGRRDGQPGDVDVEVLSQGTPRLAALASQELDQS